MPPGTMKWKKTYGKIDGELDSDGIIQIDYRFERGIIPGTGKRYLPRDQHAHLPYNKKGRTALAMLIEAFKRKLTFTIGQRST
jgi:hypothetical protein